jgi:hypothetical protein
MICKTCGAYIRGKVWQVGNKLLALKRWWLVILLALGLLGLINDGNNRNFYQAVFSEHLRWGGHPSQADIDIKQRDAVIAATTARREEEARLKEVEQRDIRERGQRKQGKVLRGKALIRSIRID